MQVWKVCVWCKKPLSPEKASLTAPEFHTHCHESYRFNGWDDRPTAEEEFLGRNLNMGHGQFLILPTDSDTDSI